MENPVKQQRVVRVGSASKRATNTWDDLARFAVFAPPEEEQHLFIILSIIPMLLMVITEIAYSSRRFPALAVE